MWNLRKHINSRENVETIVLHPLNLYPVFLVFCIYFAVCSHTNRHVVDFAPTTLLRFGRHCLVFFCIIWKQLCQSNIWLPFILPHDMTVINKCISSLTRESNLIQPLINQVPCFLLEYRFICWQVSGCFF